MSEWATSGGNLPLQQCCLERARRLVRMRTTAQRVSRVKRGARRGGLKVALLALDPMRCAILYAQFAIDKMELTTTATAVLMRSSDSRTDSTSTRIVGGCGIGGEGDGGAGGGGEGSGGDGSGGGGVEGNGGGGVGYGGGGGEGSGDGGGGKDGGEAKAGSQRKCIR